MLNVGVASYLTYEVTHTLSHDQNLACKLAIKDPQAEEQCNGFLGFATWVYLVIAAAVILAEICRYPTCSSYFPLSLKGQIDGVVIVTRYLNQLKREKARARMDIENAFQLKHRNANGYSYARLPDPAAETEPLPLQPYYLEPSDTEFDPYTESGILSTDREAHFGGEPLPPEVGDKTTDTLGRRSG